MKLSFFVQKVEALERELSLMEAGRQLERESFASQVSFLRVVYGTTLKHAGDAHAL